LYFLLATVRKNKPNYSFASDQQISLDGVGSNYSKDVTADNNDYSEMPDLDVTIEQPKRPSSRKSDNLLDDSPSPNKVRDANAKKQRSTKPTGLDDEEEDMDRSGHIPKHIEFGVDEEGDSCGNSLLTRESFASSSSLQAVHTRGGTGQQIWVTVVADEIIDGEAMCRISYANYGHTDLVPSKEISYQDYGDRSQRRKRGLRKQKDHARSPFGSYGKRKVERGAKEVAETSCVEQLVNMSLMNQKPVVSQTVQQSDDVGDASKTEDGETSEVGAKNCRSRNFIHDPGATENEVGTYTSERGEDDDSWDTNATPIGQRHEGGTTSSSIERNERLPVAIDGGQDLATQVEKDRGWIDTNQNEELENKDGENGDLMQEDDDLLSEFAIPDLPFVTISGANSGIDVMCKMDIDSVVVVGSGKIGVQVGVIQLLIDIARRVGKAIGLACVLNTKLARTNNQKQNRLAVKTQKKGYCYPIRFGKSHPPKVNFSLFTNIDLGTINIKGLPFTLTFFFIDPAHVPPSNFCNDRHLQVIVAALNEARLEKVPRFGSGHSGEDRFDSQELLAYDQFRSRATKFDADYATAARDLDGNVKWDRGTNNTRTPRNLLYSAMLLERFWGIMCFFADPDTEDGEVAKYLKTEYTAIPEDKSPMSGRELRHVAQSMVYNAVVTLTAAGVKEVGLSTCPFEIPLNDAAQVSRRCTENAKHLHRRLLTEVFALGVGDNFSFANNTKLYVDIGIEMSVVNRTDLLLVPLYTAAHREAVYMLTKDSEGEVPDECKLVFWNYLLSIN
jgi:hypothetical protein